VRSKVRTYRGVRTTLSLRSPDTTNRLCSLISRTVSLFEWIDRLQMGPKVRSRVQAEQSYSEGCNCTVRIRMNTIE
jgi:hypothetical protein